MYVCSYVSRRNIYILLAPISLVIMKLSTARKIAKQVKDELSPYCDRIVIAGSVRRGKTYDLHDIEFVAIPRFEMQPDLFMTMQPTGKNLLFSHIRKTYDVAVGGKQGQKMVRFNVCESIQVEVYTASKRNWGYILALRTGPADLSKILVTKLKVQGYKLDSGSVLKKGSSVPVRTEHDMFRMAGIKYREATARV